MLRWFHRRAGWPENASRAQSVREKYGSFRELLALNNECLERMAALQEDLQFTSPCREAVGENVAGVFAAAGGVVAALERLSGCAEPHLRQVLAAQREEVERYLAAGAEASPPLALRLSEVDAGSVAEAGGKAALLGEIRNRMGLPAPEGFVVTTEAHRRFCGAPLWRVVRDALRNLDPADAPALGAASRALREAVLAAAMPRAVEVAIEERARELAAGGATLAVRSSATGEGGAHSYPGQFVSLLNVPAREAAAAYRKVVAGRFLERALCYRLCAGIPEAESPLAVLFLPLIRARAAGILYTRDPGRPSAKVLWIMAARGLAVDIAGGEGRGDLFVVSRKRPWGVVEQSVAVKADAVAPGADGALRRLPLTAEEASAPSLGGEHLARLAEWGVRIEEHFGAPQDVEWALDEEGRIWILQTRPLKLAAAGRTLQGRLKAEPLARGGRTVFPGRVSGPAWPADDSEALDRAPAGAVVFVRKASPELMRVLGRAAGVVAEWGNVAGHAAALLREFQTPSVFLMEGAAAKVRPGQPVSLDASRAALYAGALWPRRAAQGGRGEAEAPGRADPLSRRLLALSLTQPGGPGFRGKACKSAHDVLRYCHEKACDAMFAANDREVEVAGSRAVQLATTLPLNVYVLDLGGGIDRLQAGERKIRPEQVLSRPFRALWKGLTHPDVSWTREMPISFGDLASVFTNSFSPANYVTRSLGERSFLLAAGEYFNLNARLAYHFTLIDACLSDTASANCVSFRFAGGGATRPRRSLRAGFLELCLAHHGFTVDRRGDLVNAWFKGAPPEQLEEKLDILGRLTACSCQLDMYMTGEDVMQWYVRQFLEGNYSFALPDEEPAEAAKQGG